MFTHQALIHIGLNMLALWILGPQLEAALGRPLPCALLPLRAGGRRRGPVPDPGCIHHRRVRRDLRADRRAARHRDQGAGRLQPAPVLVRHQRDDHHLRRGASPGRATSVGSSAGCSSHSSSSTPRAKPVGMAGGRPRPDRRRRPRRPRREPLPPHLRPARVAASGRGTTPPFWSPVVSRVVSRCADAGREPVRAAGFPHWG